MSDAAVAQFTEITGASPQVASQYLQITDNNLESAMQLYFENDGAALQIPDSEQQQQQSSSRQRSTGYEDEDGVVHLDSDDETPSAQQGARGNTFDDDMEMARRLQEEMYAEGDASRSDGVRAPMARTTETLVGPESNWGGYGGIGPDMLGMGGRGRGRGECSCHALELFVSDFYCLCRSSGYLQPTRSILRLGRRARLHISIG